MKNIDTIAIGGFDGMHEGHQHLFEVLGEKGAIVVIETGYANLTPGEEREYYAHHPLLFLPLDSIRMLDDKGFMTFLKQTFPQLKRIVVGYDFRFGKDRRYALSHLRDVFDGEVVVIDEVCVDGDSVHSHKIRAKLKIGDIVGANRFLGHTYTMRGRVEAGQGLGKKALVPTINMRCDGFLVPMEGVYASVARIDGQEFYRPSVTFVGHRLSTDGHFAVETHLFDEAVTCEQRIDIGFIKRIRDNKKFDSLEALKQQIDEDIVVARRLLGRLEL